MRIKSVQAIPVRLPRDIAGSRGTAGSPTALSGEGAYRWSTAYPSPHPVHPDTAPVRLEHAAGSGVSAQAPAPLAPALA